MNDDSKPCKCGCGQPVIRRPGMSPSRFKKTEFINGHNHNRPELPVRYCACGCGKEMVRPEGLSYGHFKRQRFIKGHHYNHPDSKGRVIEGLKAAHARGAFEEGFKKRKEATRATYPLCKCGCGKPVGRRGFLYAHGCFDATTPENQAKARAARDIEKLRRESAIRLTERMAEWKATGKLDEIRRKARNARGQLDHLGAKVWIIRNPFGRIYKFSNLNEWARNNEHLFKDDRPQSKHPFWLRISGGIGDLLSKHGKCCSYRGWTIVSKLELDEGGRDLLGRDYFEQAEAVA